MGLECEWRVLLQARAGEVIGTIERGLRLVQATGLREDRGQLIVGLERSRTVLALRGDQQTQRVAAVFFGRGVVGKSEVGCPESKLNRRLGVGVGRKSGIKRSGSPSQHLADGWIVRSAGAGGVRGAQQIVRQESVDGLRARCRTLRVEARQSLLAIEVITDPQTEKQH